MFNYFKIGVEIISAIGVDAMITTAANLCMPKTYGLMGLAQKVCVKTGSVGLSLVAARSITKAIDEYVEEFKTIAEQELEKADA